MIEVERKFQPTEEQYKLLLDGAVIVEEIVLNDKLYDFPDYRLLKNDIRLRNRNGSFELKIGKSEDVAEEIEDKETIEKYFSTQNLDDFVKNNLIAVTDYTTKRCRYKKGEFTIDIDEMSFGYKVCEIEILVENIESAKEAEGKIINLVNKLGIEIKNLPSKRSEYFRVMKPEIYQELYGKK